MAEPVQTMLVRRVSTYNMSTADNYWQIPENCADLDTRPALPVEAPPELEPEPEPESELLLSRLPLLLLLSSSSSSLPRPAEAAPSFWAIGANLPPPPDCALY